MAVSSKSGTRTLSWSDEIGLLPLFITLLLPVVIGVIVLVKCVWNQCCLRKTTAKSYTVKPTLKSWRGTETQENTRAATEGKDAEPSTSGSSRVPPTAQHIVHNSLDLPPAEEEDRPIPPRRSGSGQWRRMVGAQGTQNSTNDNQVNFSGDSQDSRGYTEFSGRGPQQNSRQGDPHYVTVSDDSEEMYAAIEGEGNYMRIPGDDSRHWQVERREGNSPLPPVPPPISPAFLTSAAQLAQPPSLPPSLDPIVPPIYAQVTKTKKSGPTKHCDVSSTTASTSSQIPSTTTTQSPCPQPSSSSHKRHNHTQVVSDGAEGCTEIRRWSKADINYSEFEVIREAPFASKPTTSTGVDLLDEDNYNIVAEVRTTARLPSRRRPESVPIASCSRTLPYPTTSNSIPHHPYAEISNPPPLPPLDTTVHSRTEDGHYSKVDEGSGECWKDPSHHPYTELTHRSPTDHYQQIGERGGKRNNVYQKIGRRGAEESEEDEEDEMYEKVKGPPLPTHGNPSALKHGYEKIKRKGESEDGSSCLPPALPPESDEDGSLYEQVKYTPPYERLQESAEDLDKRKESSGKSPCVAEAVHGPTPLLHDNVSNLYARVDLTKKKRNTIHT